MFEMARRLVLGIRETEGEDQEKISIAEHPVMHEVSVRDLSTFSKEYGTSMITARRIIQKRGVVWGIKRDFFRFFQGLLKLR